MYVDLQHRVTPGRLTDPYKRQKVGFSTEFTGRQGFMRGACLIRAFGTTRALGTGFDPIRGVRGKLFKIFRASLKLGSQESKLDESAHAK